MTKRVLVCLIALGLLGLAVGTAVAKSSRSKTAWLGIYSQSVDADMAEAFDLPVRYGAIINDVVDDSPADEAGLKQDDIITKFNATEVTDSDELTELIEEASPDDKVSLTIFRRGKEQTISVTLGTAPRGRSFVFNSGHTPRVFGNWDKSFGNWWSHDDHDTYIGISLMDMGDQLREYFGIKDNRGVLITEVEEDSPAEKAGLKAGDVVVQIDGRRVNDPGDISSRVQRKDEGDTVAVTVVRRGAEQTINIVVAEREDGSEDYGWYGEPAMPAVPAIPAPPAPPAPPAIRSRSSQRFHAAPKAPFSGLEYQKEMAKARAELDKLREELKAEADIMGGHDKLSAAHRDALAMELEALQEATSHTAEQARAMALDQVRAEMEALQDHTEQIKRSTEQIKEAAMERARAARERTRNESGQSEDEELSPVPVK